MTGLTVVIPSRDRGEILTRTLAGLASQSTSDFEILVVLDGRDQELPGKGRFPGVRFLVQDRAGPGVARNTGAAAAGSPLVLFLGDDMVPDADLVARHLAGHDRYPAEEDAVLGHVDWHPEVAGDRLARWLERSGTQFDFAGIPPGGDAGFGRFYSCNLSLKRSFFLDNGGFDEAFSYYYEDLDCGWRLSGKGMQLHYEPGATTGHLHRYDEAALARRFEGIGSGERLMAARHPWFEPFYLDRIRGALDHGLPSSAWPRLADRLPRRLPGLLRRRVEARADDWYHHRLSGPFLAGWAAAEDLADLRDYLADDFDPALLAGHEGAVDRERESAPDEETFYRTSRNYLYDLTVFAMSQTKAPYLAELRAAVGPGARLLDWGCGIGADGLRLLAGGHVVAFADFANPSAEFLRWRLARRGVDAPVYDLDRDLIPGGFDCAYSFDVIEHVEDPFAFLAELESRAGLVAVNLLEEDEEDTDLHRPLPVGAILAHAQRSGLVRYRRYHGRSHLLLYRSPSAPPWTTPGRIRSGAERRLGRFLPGRDPWFPVPPRR